MAAAGVAAGLLLLSWPLGAWAELPPILTRDEIRPGLRGEVHTVYQGTQQERVPLEILGLAPGFAGPGRDVIVARLEGPLAQRAGVVSGMSGSPVLIDGRLAGALSYRIGAFPQEAFAGITLIEDMLAIPAAGTNDAGETGAVTPVAVDAIAPLFGLAAWPEQEPAAQLKASTPLAVSGAVTGLRSLFAPTLAARGLGPWMAALVGEEQDSDAILRAGDPVAVVLVGGDFTMAGTGTVTLVDGARVLALGHPLLRVGAIDFPMARATILATVPSLAGSFKMSRIGETIGAFHQDRSPGLAGTLGAQAQLIPVRLQVSGEDGRSSREMQFQVVRTAVLAPSLLEMVIANTILSHDLGGFAGTVTLSGEVRMGSLPPTRVETTLTGIPGGPPAALMAARHAAGVFAALRLSPFAGNFDMAVDLRLSLSPEVRMLKLEEAHLDRAWARPGQQVQVTALLRDVTGARTLLRTFDFQVPDVAPGTVLNLMVGDGAALARIQGEAGVTAIYRAASGAALSRALSAIPSTQELHLWVGREAPGLVVGAEPLPGLPLSVARVMERDGTSRERTRLGQESLYLEHQRLAGVVAGFATLQLEIR
jgi:hypothetical protein